MYFKKDNFILPKLFLSKVLIKKKKKKYPDTLFWNRIPGFIGFTIHTKIQNYLMGVL